MITYDIRFEKEEDKIALIRKSEEDFQERLFQMSQDALSDPKIRLLTLSGPSCSGKTTTAKALIHQIHLARKRVKVISLDDFYRNRATCKDTACKPTPMSKMSVFDLYLK